MQPRSICEQAGSAQLPSSPWGSCSEETNQPKAVPPSSFLGWLFFSSAQALLFPCEIQQVNVGKVTGTCGGKGRARVPLAAAARCW